MASTYSTNLAIELIGTGDQAGTWGNTTNTNLGTLIEQAISGYVTQAVSTGTDTTITIPNGATGVARNMYIELTGTGGASTNLIVPANKKLYFIFNNTSSGQVTVKVSGQTGVSVPNKAKVILVSNGTDIIDATNYIGSAVIGNITATSGTITTLASTSAIITTLTSTSAGITTLSSGSANITQLNSTSGTISTLASTSAAITTLSGTTLTYASASITNLTATSLVLSNLSIASANITTLTSSSATISTTLALSGGTANGVLYLNGSKVATSGSAITFDGTNLALTGTAPIYKLPAAGGYLFDASGNTGLYVQQISSALLGFYTGGTEQMRLNSTGLGIGTNSPAAKLHVSGAAAKLYVDLGGNNYYQATDQIWQNYGGGTEYMRLTSTGLGIGTSSPSRKLTIEASGTTFPSASNPSIRLNETSSGRFSLFELDSGQNLNIFNSQTNGTGAIKIYTGSGSGTLQATLDASGNLGLGVTPSAWSSDVKAFQIGSNGIIYNISANNYFGSNSYFDGATNKYLTTAAAGLFGSEGNTFKWYQAASGTAGNTISFTQAMTLDASGNLGVGETSPSSFGRMVVANTSAGAETQGLYLVNASTTANTAISLSLMPSNATTRVGRITAVQDGAQNISLTFSTSAAASPVERARITSGGQFLVGTTSPIENISSRGEIVLNGSTDAIFNFTNGGTIKSYLFAGANNFTVANSANGYLNFHTNNSEKARITSGGDLLVGTTTALASEGFTVVRSTGGNPVAAIRNGNAAAGQYWIYGPNSSNNYILYNDDGNGVYILDGGTSWTSSSDERIKDIIEPISNAVEKVSSLRAVIGKFKNDDENKRRSFLIAQDVQKVLPEAVSIADDELNTLGLQYTEVIPLLVAAIKEQTAMINDLKAKVAALESK